MGHFFTQWAKLRMIVQMNEVGFIEIAVFRYKLPHYIFYHKFIFVSMIYRWSGGIFLQSRLSDLRMHKKGRQRQPLQLWYYRQHRTKPTWLLCTESANIFSVILHRNPLTYDSMPAEYLYNLTKNLSQHLQHKLCAVLPIHFLTNWGRTMCAPTNCMLAYT